MSVSIKLRSITASARLPAIARRHSEVLLGRVLEDPDAEAILPRSPMRLARQRKSLARTDKPRTRADAIK
jgi:hypothetical protein